MKTIDSASAWFSFKGRRNTDVDLMARMLSMPVRKHPGRKGEYIDIPGMDGEMWLDQGGHAWLSIPVSCLVPDDKNIDAVNAWLSGSGDLIFGDEPDRVYHARITEEFSRSNRAQRLRGQEFTIPFDCEPYRYSANAAADTVIVTESTHPITNPGTAESLPLLKVEGYGDGTVMIGQNTLLFSDISEPVFVDCEAKIAYTGEENVPHTLATQHVTGEWMRIEPGLNFVSFTGGITSVTIVPRWRWL